MMKFAVLTISVSTTGILWWLTLFAVPLLLIVLWVRAGGMKRWKV